jgi:hypothetical protein
MPLGKPEDFGTDPAGYRVNDYCRHCYVNGGFTEPKITMDVMLERCVGIMEQQGIMSVPQARTLLTQVMPRLKRWRTPVGVG